MRLRRSSAFAFVVVTFVAFAALAGCDDSVHSTMTIDGQVFGPDQCRNLQDEEMYGVDLQDENSGVTLRLVVQVDDSIDVVVFPNDGSHPVTMTGCANVHLDHSSNDKEGHYTIDGDAEIDCSAGAYVVKGKTSFELCGHDY